MPAGGGDPRLSCGARFPADADFRGAAVRRRVGTDSLSDAARPLRERRITAASLPFQEDKIAFYAEKKAEYAKTLFKSVNL